ncbi:MAG: hypothetical protein LKE29_06485 [Acidaminococcaceae bacterium]|jgi:Skp family chaperone for outer membrane proteins|nr:hypothetical protein [Acidaminococcaceae bacterium]
MKKIIALAALLVMAFSTISFAACNGDYCTDEASCKQQQQATTKKSIG